MRHFGGGQASLEMTAALIGALILLAGCIRVFTWLAGRIVARQTSYDASRPTSGKPWQNPNAFLWDEPANDQNQQLHAVR